MNQRRLPPAPPARHPYRCSTAPLPRPTSASPARILSRSRSAHSCRLHHLERWPRNCGPGLTSIGPMARSLTRPDGARRGCRGQLAKVPGQFVLHACNPAPRPACRRHASISGPTRPTSDSNAAAAMATSGLSRCSRSPTASASCTGKGVVVGPPIFPVIATSNVPCPYRTFHSVWAARGVGGVRLACAGTRPLSTATCRGRWRTVR